MRETNSLGANTELLQVLVMRDVLIDGSTNDLGRLSTVLVRPIFILRFNGTLFLFLVSNCSAGGWYKERAAYLSMTPGLQAEGVNSIIVETIPLGEMLHSMLSVVLAPLKHTILEVDASAITVLPQGSLGIVQHVIRIQNRQPLLVHYPLTDQEIKQLH